MDATPRRPIRDTGPLELRSYGSAGRKLGTFEDCYDGSPWELHRGELVEQMGSKDIHGAVMALLAALFRTHARAGMTILTDVYCDLSDAKGPSLRAPDVTIVGDLRELKDAPYTGTPIIAVEVRGTQSKRYLEEKVALYLEHDWPTVWIAHAERGELEVVRTGAASVVYRPGAEVPLVPELDKYGLRAVPTEAIFDQQIASRFVDEWAHREGREAGRVEEARAALARVLARRGLDVRPELAARIAACTDLATLARWLDEAVVAATSEDALR